MKNEFIALIILFLLVSCQSRQQVTENISTIDSILQVNVTSLLENKLSELDALSGQAIVMEVQSGQIKALVGLTKKDSPIKDYKNIMYSLHFYANEWSHNEHVGCEWQWSDQYDKYREMAEKAGSDKCELFLLEFDKQKRVQCLIGSGKQ